MGIVNIPPPIRLSPEDVEEFRRLIFEEYSEQLSNEEAWQRAHLMSRLFEDLRVKTRNGCIMKEIKEPGSNLTSNGPPKLVLGFAKNLRLAT